MGACGSRKPANGSKFDMYPLQSRPKTGHQEGFHSGASAVVARPPGKRSKDLLCEERAKFKTLLGYFGRYILDLNSLASRDFLSLLKEDHPEWPSELLHLKSRLLKYADPPAPVFSPLDAEEDVRDVVDEPTLAQRNMLSLMHLYYVCFQEIFVTLFVASSAMESGCLDVAGRLESIPVSTDVHSMRRTTSGLSSSSSSECESVAPEIVSSSSRSSSGNSIGSAIESKEYVFGRIFDQFSNAIPAQGCLGTLVNSCETEGVLSRKIYLAKCLLRLSPAGTSELSPVCDAAARVLSLFREEKLLGLHSSTQRLDCLRASVVKLVAVDIEKILWNLEIGLFSADVSTPKGKSDAIRHFVSSICSMSSADKCLMNYVGRENAKPKSEACSRIFSSLNRDCLYHVRKMPVAYDASPITDSNRAAFVGGDDRPQKSIGLGIPRKLGEDPRSSGGSAYYNQHTKWSSCSVPKPEIEC